MSGEVGTAAKGRIPERVDYFCGKSRPVDESILPGRKGQKWATGPQGPVLDGKTVYAHPGKFNEILHQVRTNEVYFSLSKGERETYKIGDVLEIEKGTYKGGSDVVPDASYMDESGEEVYIETDCGSYTGKQVRDKVNSFGGKKTIWVCTAGRKNFLYKHGARGKFFTYPTAGLGRIG